MFECVLSMVFVSGVLSFSGHPNPHLLQRLGQIISCWLVLSGLHEDHNVVCDGLSVTDSFRSVRLEA